MVIYRGIVIEESLKDLSALNDLKIVKTDTETVTVEHETSHLKKWTLHHVEIPAEIVERVADKLSRSLDVENGHWYADFKTGARHYVIFSGRVFTIDRSSRRQYEAVRQYGIKIGIPEHQLDFSQDIKEWQN